MGRRDIKHDNPHVLYDIQATRPRARACILHTILMNVASWRCANASQHNYFARY